MARLTSRQKFIPGGFKFYDPHLKWTAPANASFQVICDGLRNVRMANPGVTKANNLTTDASQIADEIDAYNAAICQAHGWNDFITGQGGASVPFPQAQPRPFSQRAANLAVGAAVSIEWLASGADSVPIEQANARAEVCSRCPLNNKQGDLLSRFTAATQEAFRAQLNRKREMKLETTFDSQLGTCDACDCPLPLKVFLPFEKFYPKMLSAAKNALNKENPRCWILVEAEK